MLCQCVVEVTGHTIEQCVWPLLCQCVGEVTGHPIEQCVWPVLDTDCAGCVSV